MPRSVFVRLRWPLVVICLVAVQIVYSAAPEIPRMSKYAPAADLLEQVDFFLGRVEQSLADPAEYEGAPQSRTLKDANTLAALALVLGVHDENFPEKSAMPGVLTNAQALAAAEANYEQARSAFAKLKADKANPAGGEVKWQGSASLPILMKQVPLVYNGLKRGVEPNRLKRQAQQSAGQTATLVAIAVASALDTSYAKSPEQAAQWVELCDQMRDAAGEVNSAVHAQDAGRVTAGMKRLHDSCEACHAKFRH